MASAILDAGGDDGLALKQNQQSFHAEAAAYFAGLQTTGLDTLETIDKDHGRPETRRTTVSHDLAWLTGPRRTPTSRARRDWPTRDHTPRRQILLRLYF